MGKTALSNIGRNAGRIILASLFILAGLNKLMNYEETALKMQSEGLVPTALLLPLTIALELGGGLTVAFGRRFTLIAGLALTVFTLATNVFFHRFWELDGPGARLELSLFFKNVAIAGGLLYVATTANEGKTAA